MRLSVRRIVAGAAAALVLAACATPQTLVPYTTNAEEAKQRLLSIIKAYPRSTNYRFSLRQKPSRF